MSMGDWYDNREILLTGVTSELGRALLEKLLRALPNVKIYAILRSRNSLYKGDRMKRIFASPGYERLRLQEPTAISRVKVLEGNLLYENFGLSKEDNLSLSAVDVVFHAAGPQDEVLKFSQQLPQLRTIVVASSLFKYKGLIAERPCNENFPPIPLALLRIPLLGPAYKEPIPGFVEILKGTTAFMVGAGYALGNSNLPAEVYPIDLVVNTMIAAAWERGLRNRVDEPTVYNAPNLGCTWGEMIEKGKLANRKFSYPTFGIRGMTSASFFHSIMVILLEWMPSVLCDMIVSPFGAKPRCVSEYEHVRKSLRSLEPIALKSWPVERSRVYQLQECLSLEDRDTYPICPEIDLEFYILCAAATARKYCANEINQKVVKTFTRFFIAVVVILTLYCIFK